MKNKKSGFTSRIPGFTLVELLVSIAIIAMLITISMISYGKISANSRDSRRVTDIITIQQALELYHRDEGSYPSALTSGQALMGSSTANIYISKIPIAPTPNDGDCTGTQNTYNYTLFDDDHYALSYCLGDDTSKVKKGVHCATQNGLVTNTTCPAPAFSPISLPNLTLWFSADFGISKDSGNKVSAWSDRSGNAHNATQTTASNQPIYTDNQLNGKPALSYNGNNGLFFGNLTFSQWSLFSVAERTGGSRFPLISYDSQRQGMVLENNMFYVFNQGGDLIINYPTPAVTYKIFESIYDGNTLSFYENGILIGNASGARTMDVNNIGLYEYSNAQGYFAETLMYNGALTTSSRQEVESYLNSKYHLY
jgi:prepilin-type N-terminal cleavage/methylation domain-containing protein